MLGKHCNKTWAASQGALALSSAEAECYAMIEAVTRAKGLLSLAKELVFEGISNVVKINNVNILCNSYQTYNSEHVVA